MGAVGEQRDREGGGMCAIGDLFGAAAKKRHDTKKRLTVVISMCMKV